MEVSDHSQRLVWADSAAIRERSQAAVADQTLQKNLAHASDHEREARRTIEREYDWPKMRAEAKAFRDDAVAHMPALLDELEGNIRELGGEVFRASDGAEAREYVAEVCKSREAQLVVKGKSMLSEEIDLNAELEKHQIKVVESDLGEYIIQLLDDHPSHIVAPAIHLNAEQVAELFSNESGKKLEPGDTQALVNYAREVLRADFLRADVGISGANFAVAETGTVIVVESEGNIRMTTSLPRCHIVVMGIEKVVRDFKAAAHLVQMLPLAANGTRMNANVSFISGSARSGDDGPEEFHLVLVDNGRSEIANSKYREALNCIRCGACLAACPVYRQVGGHTYGSTYSGPIGAVITPLLAGTQEAGQLADLSSLCGACREVCPVDIPLDDHLVMLRSDERQLGGARTERRLFEAWARVWSRPASYRSIAATGGKLLFSLLERFASSKQNDRTARRWIKSAPFPLARWTEDRDIRPLAAEPFHVRWRKKRGR